MGVRKRGRRNNRRAERRIWVRGIHRDTPDLRKLSRALLAIAQAEAEAQAEEARRRGDSAAEQEAADED